MTKYFLLLTLIYINSLSYAKGNDTLLNHSHSATRPISLALKADSVGAETSVSALQKSSYLSYIPGYEWVETIQNFIKKKLDVGSFFINEDALLIYTLRKSYNIAAISAQSYIDSILDYLFPQSLYPRSLSWIMRDHYTIEPEQWVTKVSLNMGEALYGLSLETRLGINARMKKKMKEVFYNLSQEKGDRIPHITHRTWITGTQSPREPSKKHLKSYIQSLKKLSGTWEHNFWCVDPNDIPEAIKALKESGVHINIHKLEEIFPHMKAKHIFDAYYQDKQFCFASDIARHNIIYLYGGIYADLGALFLHDLTPYADAYDHMFATASAWLGFLDVSFFGCKKKQPYHKRISGCSRYAL